MKRIYQAAGLLFMSMLLLSCASVVTTDYGKMSGGIDRNKLVTRHWILYNSDYSKTPPRKNFVGGVIVHYTRDQQDQPKFTWSTKDLELLINDQPQDVGDDFVLIVNDKRGNPVTLLLSKDVAFSIFTTLELLGDKLHSSTTSDNSGDVYLIDVFWKRYIEPRINNQ